MVLSHIGHTKLHETIDHRAHLVHMLGCTRLNTGLQIAECRHVSLKLRIGAFRHPTNGFIEGKIRVIPRGTGVNLVINVGNVARIGDMFCAIDMTQQTKQHVENDHRTGIAYMREVINRWSADIHRTLSASRGENSSFVRVSVLYRRSCGA